MTGKMRAAQYDAYGPPSVLRVREMTRPTLRPGHVLVRTAATSLNAADVLVRSGKLRIFSGGRFPRGTGFDFTGDLVEVGPDVSELQVGDLVWGFLNGIRQGPLAAAAQYVLAPASAVARRPNNFDAVAAAALPGAGGAALGALRDHGRLCAGERVLIRGGAGGVGVAAVQIARALGAHVVATVRESHLERVQQIGAHEAFDYRATRPGALGKFDVIVDPVATNLRAFRRLLRPGGRFLALTLGGFGDALTWITSVMFGGRRVRFVQTPPGRKLLADLTTLAEAGQIAPVVERIHPLGEIGEAHRAFEAGGGFGKHVVRTS